MEHQLLDGTAESFLMIMVGGLVAQWITRLTTDQKIPGSNPGKLDITFSFQVYLI